MVAVAVAVATRPVAGLRTIRPVLLVQDAGLVDRTVHPPVRPSSAPPGTQSTREARTPLREPAGRARTRRRLGEPAGGERARPGRRPLRRSDATPPSVDEYKINRRVPTRSPFVVLRTGAGTRDANDE